MAAAAHAVSLKRALPPVYAAAALRLATPLLALPVMASRLGAEGFGRLGLALVWAGLLAIVVEGGFLGAATRRAVVATAAQRLLLAQQVFSARCVLCVAVAAGVWAATAAGWAPAGNAVLLAGLGCALGGPATWYLQATSQLHRWARVELAVQAALLTATLTVARSIEVYLLLQLLAAATLAVLGWRRLRHDLAVPPGALWAARQVLPGLRLGASMLPVSLAGAAYSLALPALAAARMAPGELGVYYLADRVVRALLYGSDPLVQLIYPRIVSRFRDGARAALRYAARWALGGLVAGALLLAALLLATPLAGRALAGVDALRLHGVLKVLGVLLPLLMGWKFIGFWMLGSGRYDPAYRASIVAGGLCGAVGAWQLGHDAVALAGVALGAEAAVICTALAGMARAAAHQRTA